jgi:hypothetical protein
MVDGTRTGGRGAGIEERSIARAFMLSQIRRSGQPASGASMQPDNFIYMPRWLKIIAVVTLGVLACGAVALTLHYLDIEAEADWVVLSFSIAQAALSILIRSLLACSRGETLISLNFLQSQIVSFSTRFRLRSAKSKQSKTVEPITSRKPRSV